MGYPGPRAVAAKHLFRSRDMREVDFVDTITYATKGRADGWDRCKRWGTRLRKAIPDFLLLFNHYVFKKLPVYAFAKRLFFRLPDRRHEEPDH